MEMTQEQMLARIAELEKQITNKGNTARIKISPKGAVSFYGVGRWPISLYKSQWEVVFANVEALKAFITANESHLSVKADKAEATAVPATA
jgi:predicted esterase